ncbi:MAG: amino acid ABC transporter permease, partial [Firmicutes bacterium]|nr:amino acid ABC transporter permease [Candidatus Colimorpha enterica]
LGVGTTMIISVVGTIIWLIIGLINVVIRTVPTPKMTISKIILKIANILITVYVEFFRGTPLMVQAMVIFWGYAYATGGSTLPLLPAGIGICAINTGAYVTEIIRGGIISVDKGQFDGAQSIGLNHMQTMVHVIIPQVLRNVLPAVSNEFVVNIKDTSVLNVIGVTELFRYTQIVAQSNLKIFPTYIISCLIYLVLTFTVTVILRAFERLLAGKKTYKLFDGHTVVKPEEEV